MFRLALALVALAVTAALASPARAEPTTLRVNLSETDFDYVDPALAYFQPSWQLLYVTCAMLVNYPDEPGEEGTRLQPELAAAMPAISADGKTYTFQVRSDFTFSPPANRAVGAQDVKDTFERLATPGLNSPATRFYRDIVGFNDRVAGTSPSIAGITVEGQTITFTLERPAGDFLARLAMPFACVLPSGTPMDPAGIQSFGSAGPYYIESRTPNHGALLKQNPNYHGDRPHHFDQIAYTVQTNVETSLQQVESGEADYDAGGLPPSAHARLYEQYGPESPVAAVGRQQYFVNPEVAMRYFSLKTTRPTFSKLKLRQAVNYALDRPALIAQRGFLAGQPTDQYLAPGTPGFQNESIYPLDGPDLDTARRLVAEAGGAPAEPIVVYTGNTAAAQNTAAVLKANLEAIGFTVDVQSFSSGEMYRRCGTRTEPVDVCNAGWIADYNDPFDFLMLFDGTTIRDQNNNNLSYFDDAVINQRIADAETLAGEPRYTAFGDLDVDLARYYAPVAAWMNDNAREFFSSRIRCRHYSETYPGMSLGALCLAPANDDFADRQPLSGDTGSAEGTTDGASKETGEPNHAGASGGASIWYRWTAPTSGPAMFDTCGSDFDTVLAVYTGSSVGALTPVASNDDACELGSRVGFTAVAGAEYEIAVDGFVGDRGHVVLAWSRNELRFPPAEESPPEISGQPKDGETLTASTGVWRGTPPMTFSFAWLRCDPFSASCMTISGATARTHTLTSAEVGSRLRILVTATNAAGSDYAASAPTGIVTAAAPAVVSAPTIEGVPLTDEVLAASPGGWRGTSPSFAYQWQRCNTVGEGCLDLAGENTEELVLTSAHVGFRIRVVVTATNVAGGATAASAPTEVVRRRVAPVRCVVPSVRGKTVRVARRMLGRRHCRLGKITLVFSRRVRKGIVISQRPRAGRRLRSGAKVNLVVSRGRRR